MTDANVEDVFDGVIDQEEPIVEDKPQDHVEDKPAPRGYMSKEAWIEAGRDPEDWVSPEVFKERGERIKMKAEYDNKLKNMSLYYEKAMEIQRNDLLARRDEAIDTADKAAVKAIDKELKELDQIEALNKQQEEQEIVKPAEILEWEAENPWIFDASDPRVNMAKRIYKSAVDSGKTVGTALRMVDRELSSKFIDTSKKPAQIAESSRASTGKGEDVKPTMANLSAEELKIWQAGVFDSKDDFLKAVQADRKFKAGKK